MRRVSRHIIALLTAVVSGCASDNVHMPEPDTRPTEERFTGELVSWIPDFADVFAPVHNDDFAEIHWLNSAHSRADIVIGEFSLYIDIVDMHITIGEMTIENVSFKYDADGSTATFARPDFETMAGQYDTKGSISGNYSSEGLSFEMEYKPGSMPFLVKSSFASNKTIR